MQNQFLKDFMEMRKTLAPHPAKVVPGLNKISVPDKSTTLSFATIIDSKPGKKKVRQYLSEMRDGLLAEMDI